MKKDDILKSLANHKKIERKANLIGIPILFILLFANVALITIAEKMELPEWVYGIWIGAFLIILIVAAWMCLASRKRLIRKLGLLCPFCKSPIIGISAEIVVSTGVCGKCGNRIIEEQHHNSNDYTDHDSSES